MTTDVLELLVDHYATGGAPPPNADLAARMDDGRIGTADHDRDAVVVALPPRRRARARVLLAATVATFVAFSGLAVAGALPDPIQRGVASVASDLGIDLPSPETAPARAPSDGQRPGGQPSNPNDPSPAESSTPTTPGNGAAPSGGEPSTTSTTARGALGELGVSTTLPTVAPPTVPPIPDPPFVTVPQLTPPGIGPLPPFPLPLP